MKTFGNCRRTLSQWRLYFQTHFRVTSKILMWRCTCSQSGSSFHKDDFADVVYLHPNPGKSQSFHSITNLRSITNLQCTDDPPASFWTLSGWRFHSRGYPWDQEEWAMKMNTHTKEVWSSRQELHALMSCSTKGFENKGGAGTRVTNTNKIHQSEFGMHCYLKTQIHQLSVQI
jgi:hypothetical protein